MIDVTPELVEAVTGGAFHPSYVCDLIVDGDVKISNHALTQCELVSDTGQKVVTQGTATFTYTDDLGESILPTDLTSWLVPYASFLDVSYRVADDSGFEQQVLRGRFKIVGVSDAQGRVVKFQDRVLAVGEQVTLKLADMFYITDYERFLAPSAPSALNSVYAEIGTLTGFGIEKSVPDAEITRAVTYKDNRLDAVCDLAKIITATPYMTPAGLVGFAADEWPAPVVDLKMGAEGTLSRADPDDLSDAQIYNQVVVRSWDDSQSTVLATAEVPSGPLRYGGPFGRKPTFLSSQFVVTVAQAQAYANQQLPLVSKAPAVMYTLQCVADPRLEAWDVINFDTPHGDVLPGRIQKLTLPSTGMMTLSVSVDRG